MPRSVRPITMSRNLPPLSVLLFAVCGGILLDRWLPLHGGCWWIGGLIALVVWARCTQVLPRTGLTCLLLAVTTVAASWHHVRWHLFPADHFVRFAPENDQLSLPLRIIGVVGSAPRRIPEDDTRSDPLATGDRAKFLIDVERIGTTSSRGVSGRATVQVRGHLLGIKVGDRVQIDGRLRAIPGPMNPGQRDPRLYLRGLRQLGSIDVPYPDSITVIDRNVYRVQHLPALLRAQAESILQEHVPADQYGLAATLLLGARDTLQPSIRDSFFYSGTIHLLAVSGLHVGILAWGFLAAARGRVLPWRPALYTVITLTLLYAFVTESRAPVVRASLLVQIVCASWIMRRRLSPLSAMSAAGLLVLVRNPTELFSSGTQLSFLAVATLSWVGGRLTWQAVPLDPLERLVWKSRPSIWRIAQHLLLTLKQMTIASLTVWLVTLPLVANRFHLVSPWSVPLNLVLWIPVAAALFSGLGIFLFHSWIPPLAGVCGQFCDVSLRLMLHTVQSVESLPGSHVWVVGPSSLWVALFYLFLGITVWHRSLRHSALWWIAAVVAGTLLPVAENAVEKWREGKSLRCTILSVGHGTCVFVEFPNGFKLLCDAGRIGATRSSVERVSRFLWSRRVRRIDAVVVSHADADHYNLLPELLGRFPVSTLYTNPRPASEDILSPLLELARDCDVACRQWSDGCELAPTPGYRIRVLHPPSGRLQDTDNANSLVLTIDAAGYTVLLPGDLEGSGLSRLLSKTPIDVDVTMAPHHGSLASDPIAFTTWCSPEWIVISGSNVDVGNKLRECLDGERAHVLHTAEIGAVEILARPGRLKVSGFRRGSNF